MKSKHYAISKVLAFGAVYQIPITFHAGHLWLTDKIFTRTEGKGSLDVIWGTSAFDDPA